MIQKADFLKSFFFFLNNNHIKYFVFGEYASLPQSTGNSDLDIVVDEADLKQFKTIFTEMLKESDIKLVSYYTNSQTLFYRLLYSREQTHWGLQLDVFFKGFYHQNACYYPSDLIKKDIVLHEEINVLDIQKGYYIGFLKEFIHNCKAKDKYIIGFLNEIADNEEYYRKELSQLYGTCFCNLVFQNRTQEGLKKMFPNLHKEMFSSIHRGNKCRRIKERLSIISRFWGKRPGYVIAILGTDGSGKSTIINEITPILNEAFHNGVIYEHLRPNVLPDIGVLLSKKEKNTNPVTDPHSQKQSGLLGSMMRWSYYMIDYTWGYFKKVFPMIHLKSKIFLFDRYYYDYYIDQKRLRIHLPQWIVRFGEFFIPKPDLILCLGGDPNIIFNRKPETSLKEVSKQIEALRKFCETRKNAAWIDICLSLPESVNTTMSIIHGVLSTRFKFMKE
ncbi:hypothetical protein FACS1894181_01410 [Bacteroidia bacterium]|nr:hypothetical protein FACS1894181_01410 [Bacteroidia bacterium]